MGVWSLVSFVSFGMSLPTGRLKSYKEIIKGFFLSWWRLSLGYLVFFTSKVWYLPKCLFRIRWMMFWMVRLIHDYFHLILKCPLSFEMVWSILWSPRLDFTCWWPSCSYILLLTGLGRLVRVLTAFHSSSRRCTSHASLLNDGWYQHLISLCLSRFPSIRISDVILTNEEGIFRISRKRKLKCWMSWK